MPIPSETGAFPSGDLLTSKQRQTLFAGLPLFLTYSEGSGESVPQNALSVRPYYSARYATAFFAAVRPELRLLPWQEAGTEIV